MGCGPMVALAWSSVHESAKPCSRKREHGANPFMRVRAIGRIQAAGAWASRITGDRARGWRQTVAFTPNLRPSLRVIWCIAGLALILVGFVAPIGGWLRVALPILGLLTIASGATGW